MSLTTILYVYIHIFTFHIIHKNKTHANETGVLVYFDINVRTQTLSVSLILQNIQRLQHFSAIISTRG